MLPIIPQVSGKPCLTNKCSSCCHNTEMLLLEEDVRRISAARPGVDFYGEAEDGFLQLNNRDEEGTPCVFLYNDLCSVHDIRPRGCQLYPVVWQDIAVLDDEYCPHTADFEVPEWADHEVGILVEALLIERDDRSQRL